jgi:hypothetical protein
MVRVAAFAWRFEGVGHLVLIFHLSSSLEIVHRVTLVIHVFWLHGALLGVKDLLPFQLLLLQLMLEELLSVCRERCEMIASSVARPFLVFVVGLGDDAVIEVIVVHLEDLPLP